MALAPGEHRSPGHIRPTGHIQSSLLLQKVVSGGGGAVY